jgi:hypothetical protein
MPINVKNGLQASVLALLLSFCFGTSAAPLQMCQSFPNLWCLDVMEYSLLYSALFSASKVVENFSLITLIGFFAGLISLPICKQLQGKFGIFRTPVLSTFGKSFYSNALIAVAIVIIAWPIRNYPYLSHNEVSYFKWTLINDFSNGGLLRMYIFSLLFVWIVTLYRCLNKRARSPKLAS